jgi:hypothetical protein
MRIVVLSDHPLIRQALTGLAAQEGLRATPADTVRDVVTCVESSPDPVVVLLDALQSFTMADAFLEVAESAGIRVALLCGEETRALQYHPAVRHSLVAPFPANILRAFLRDCAVRPGPSVAKTSGIRARLELDPAAGRLGDKGRH